MHSFVIKRTKRKKNLDLKIFYHPPKMIKRKAVQGLTYPVPKVEYLF